MSLLYESMTRIQWGSWTIRVWRGWDGKYIGRKDDIQEALDSIWLRDAAFDVIQKLVELDRVNAVEMLDSSGCGTVVYKDWP